MDVFRINLGHENRFREEALQRNAILLYENASVAEARKQGDESVLRAAIIEALERVGRAAGDAQISRWHTHYRFFTESHDDLWLHYEHRRYLWWGITSDTMEVSELEPFVEEDGSETTTVKYWKPLKGGWSNKSRGGRPLGFAIIHPHALKTLSFQGTLSHIQDEDVKAYFMNLIDDGPLDGFYALPKWQESAKQPGWREQPRLATVPPEWNLTVSALVQTTISTVNSSGTARQSVAKDKRLEMTDSQLQELINRILISQDYKCALTGLELRQVGTEPQSCIASLDRIDSDGHYAEGNLQLVCRFVNFMKTDTPDEEFRHYLDLIRQSPGPLPPAG